MANLWCCWTRVLALFHGDYQNRRHRKPIGLHPCICAWCNNSLSSNLSKWIKCWPENADSRWLVIKLLYMYMYIVRTTVKGVRSWFGYLLCINRSECKLMCIKLGIILPLFFWSGCILINRACSIHIHVVQSDIWTWQLNRTLVHGTLLCSKWYCMHTCIQMTFFTETHLSNYPAHMRKG